MKDVRLNEISDRVAQEFDIPKTVARKLVNHMFKYIFKVMKTNRDRVLMMKSPLPQVYCDYDVKRMCNEMIDGDRPTWNKVLKRKLSYTHRKHIKRPKYHLLE